MPIKKACLDCGALSDRERCPEHRRAHVQRRKAAGRTGARGSTRASRQRRARVLEAAKDATGVSRCFYCGKEASIAEHYVPLAKGGADTEANLVAACRSCNQQKGDLLPGEFLRRRREGGRKIASAALRTPPGPRARKNPGS